MAATGRPPKPSEQKRRIGNPGRRPLPDVATVTPLPGLRQEVPAHLSESGQDLWEGVTTTAAAWLAPSDAPMLLMLCELMDRREEFKTHLAENGPLVMRPDGHMVANPVVAMLSTLEKQIVDVASSMGLTPTDRSRLGVAEVRAKSAFEEMIARRQSRE